MRKLFEFKCSSCELYFEELTEYTKTLPCPECGSNADKLISAPRISLEGITGSFPGAASKWVQKRKQKLAKEQESNQ
tara:strand:- start:745 stop:975 length:231 start_codon:yes stop_codon:yes gene_type:complete